jgi:hypothetical protein
MRLANKRYPGIFFTSVLVGATGLSCGAEPGDEATALGTDESAISGGTKISLQTYPGVGSIATTDGWCTGTVISPSAILTAAHCANWRDFTWSSSTGQYGNNLEKTYATREVWKHPQWDGGPNYDLAIVKTSIPIRTVAKTSVAPPQTAYSSQQFTIVGFGAPDNVKKSATVLASSDGKRVVAWNQTGIGCKGDSGGPLLKNNLQYAVLSGMDPVCPPTDTYYSPVDAAWATNVAQDLDPEPMISASTWGRANRINFFARGINGNLAFKAWDNYWYPSQTGWIDLDTYPNGPGPIPYGPMVGTPEAVSWGYNRIDIAARDTKGNAWATAWKGSLPWQKWTQLYPPAPGVRVAGHISATSWASGRIDLVAVGSDGLGYHKYFDNGAWAPQGGWLPMDAPLSADAPVLLDRSTRGFQSTTIKVIAADPGRLDAFGVGRDEHLYHSTYLSYPNWHWGAWELVDPNVRVRGDIGLARVGQGRVHVFAKHADQDPAKNNGLYLWEYYMGGRYWPATGLFHISGAFYAGTVATSAANGQSDLFGQGTDTHLYHRVCLSEGRGCGSWEDLGGSVAGTPSAVSWGPGRLDVFAANGSDFTVKHVARQAGSNWQSDNIGGPVTW